MNEIEKTAAPTDDSAGGNPPRTPTLERLEHLDVFLYKFTTRSHLAIGAGETSELAPVDKPIIRAMIFSEEKGVPYIPASSLHGVVRAWVEKVLRSLDGPAGIREKYAEFEKKNPDWAEIIRDKAKRDLGINGNDAKDLGAGAEEAEFWDRWRLYPQVCNIFWDHDRCRDYDDTPEAKVIAAWHKHIGRTEKCEVCRLFGYTGQKGRVRFTHAFPPASGIPIDIITRVAINRYTGAADEGKLFDLEAVPPGVPFYFFVILENATDREKELLEYGFKALNMQLATLGAHGTVGFGMVDGEKIVSVQIKPGIFSADQKKITNPTINNMPADYDPNRYPGFLNFLAGLPKTGVPDDLRDFLEIKETSK